MATVTYQVGASSDDAYELLSTVDIDNAFDVCDATSEYLGFRWTGVTIPVGATITAATVDPYIHGSGVDEPKHVISFEDSATPATFAATSNNISGRTKTTATVLWDSADLNAVSTGSRASDTATLPDLSTIIQELVDSYDYSAGAAMVCIMRGDTDAARDLGVKTWDNNPSFAAILTITYTEAAAGGQPMQRRGMFIPFMRRRPHGIN